jgi:DNA-binding NtrC family response regulator
LTGFDWPGNVRELENLVERLVTLSSSHGIVASDLPNSLQASSPLPPAAPQIPPQGLSFRDVVDQFESDLILQALEITHGNKNRAAQLIRMNRTTMLEKMKKKGVKFDGVSRDSRRADAKARASAECRNGPGRLAEPGDHTKAEDSPDPDRSH